MLERDGEPALELDADDASRKRLNLRSRVSWRSQNWVVGTLDGATKMKVERWSVIQPPPSHSY
jgi:hypothetical protein